jgi:hypothetical protein
MAYINLIAYNISMWLSRIPVGVAQQQPFLRALRLLFNYEQIINNGVGSFWTIGVNHPSLITINTINADPIPGMVARVLAIAGNAQLAPFAGLANSIFEFLVNDIWGEYMANPVQFNVAIGAHSIQVAEAWDLGVLTNNRSTSKVWTSDNLSYVSYPKPADTGIPTGSAVYTVFKLLCASMSQTQNYVLGAFTNTPKRVDTMINTFVTKVDASVRNNMWFFHYAIEAGTRLPFSSAMLPNYWANNANARPTLQYLDGVNPLANNAITATRWMNSVPIKYSFKSLSNTLTAMVAEAGFSIEKMTTPPISQVYDKVITQQAYMTQIATVMSIRASAREILSNNPITRGITAGNRSIFTDVIKHPTLREMYPDLSDETIDYIFDQASVNDTIQSNLFNVGVFPAIVFDGGAINNDDTYDMLVNYPRYIFSSGELTSRYGLGLGFSSQALQTGGPGRTICYWNSDILYSSGQNGDPITIANGVYAYHDVQLGGVNYVHLELSNNAVKQFNGRNYPNIVRDAAGLITNGYYNRGTWDASWNAPYNDTYLIINADVYAALVTQRKLGDVLQKLDSEGWKFFIFHPIIIENVHLDSLNMQSDMVIPTPVEVPITMTAVVPRRFFPYDGSTTYTWEPMKSIVLPWTHNDVSFGSNPQGNITQAPIAVRNANGFIPTRAYSTAFGAHVRFLKRPLLHNQTLAIAGRGTNIF